MSNNTPSSPSQAFPGLRRRDHLGRYVGVVAYSALAVVNAALLVKGLGAAKLGPEVFFNGLSLLASGVSAHGWMRTCQAFNALRDGRPDLANTHIDRHQDTMAGSTSPILNTTPLILTTINTLTGSGEVGLGFAALTASLGGGFGLTALAKHQMNQLADLTRRTVRFAPSGMGLSFSPGPKA